MNPAFFQQVETALAPERLDAYHQDAATPVVALEEVPAAGILVRAWDTLRLWLR